MPLRNQKQIMAGMDRMAGKAMRRNARAYRAATIGPLVDLISGAQSADDALARLNASVLVRMGTEPVAEAVEQTRVQAGLIGRVSAIPRKRKTTEAQRHRGEI